MHHHCFRRPTTHDKKFFSILLLFETFALCAMCDRAEAEAGTALRCVSGM
jgi:hypothetical protein